eukprot:maker-scaffold_45-snap-gene-1.110-mRNA-1 protein AED:0.05 eAED:0.05 QI:56/1/1/1/1/1/4/77/208
MKRCKSYRINFQMADISRLKKELEDCKKDEETSGIKAVKRNPNDTSKGSVRELTGTIFGPDDSVYAGGKFQIEINVPKTYPFDPPKMRFVTKVWHPNVSSQTGAICLDILKDQWSPALTIKTALLSVQALLSAPEPLDPQDAVVAGQFLKEQEKFKETAREWTRKYAKMDQEKVDRLTNMGFDEEKVRNVLREVDGDEEKAIEKLLEE